MRLRDCLFAEFVGTALLFMVVVGSDIMGSRLSDGNEYQTLLVNSLAVGFGIGALILSLNAVSGAYFNPMVSLLMVTKGELSLVRLPLYFMAQFGGAFAGLFFTHYLFGLDPFQLASHSYPGVPLFVSEVLASLGLLLVVHRVGNARSEWVAYAVGAYLLSASWFTPSHAFANPALTLARMFTDTAGGIRPQDALAFILAQFLAVGLLAAFLRAHKRFAMLGD